MHHLEEVIIKSAQRLLKNNLVSISEYQDLLLADNLFQQELSSKCSDANDLETSNKNIELNINRKFTIKSKVSSDSIATGPDMSINKHVIDNYPGYHDIKKSLILSI